MTKPLAGLTSSEVFSKAAEPARTIATACRANPSVCIRRLGGYEHANDAERRGRDPVFAPPNRDVGNVATPDLIGMVDDHALQQVGINSVCRIGLTGAGPFIYGF